MADNHFNYMRTVSGDWGRLIPEFPGVASNRNNASN